MDIYDLLFYQILKFDYRSTVLTGEFGNDILWGLLVPAIFSIIIVQQFTTALLPKHSNTGNNNDKLKSIVPIAAVAAIIQLGWFPLIASLGMTIFIILLALVAIFYFKNKIIKRSEEKRVGGALGKLISATGISGRINSQAARAILDKTPLEVANAVRRLSLIAGLYNNLEEASRHPGMGGPPSVQDYQIQIDNAVKILEEFNPKQQRDILGKVTGSKTFIDQLKSGIIAVT